MAVSRALAAALTGERASLVTEREAIDGRIAAIDLLLRGAPPATRKQARARRQTARTAPTKLPLIERVSEQTTSKLLPTVPPKLRPALRHALQGHGFRKPSEVIKFLRDAGFLVGGKTPLSTRVYNEMKRMREEGLLERDDDNRYALKGQ